MMDAPNAAPNGSAPHTGRIQLLDALRGLAIILMVAYHAGYDLVMAELIPEGVLYNPFLNVLHVIFAGSFLVLAGISSRFSRNNLKRGLLLLGCAALVSLAGWIMDVPIWFGILHLMAACVLLYWLLDKLHAVIPVMLLAAFLAVLLELGFWPDVPSADYFPIFPWGFLFFLGVSLGDPIRAGRWPRRFYEARVPVLPAVGRRTLLIYLIHQPVLYGLTQLLVYWLNKRG